MFLLPRGYVQVDTLHPRVSDLLSIPVTVVGSNGLGLGPHIPFHLLQHRHQLLLVVALLRYLRRHDHLRFAIHRDLRVVALHETALVAPIRHDPAFRVGHRLLGIWHLRFTSAHLLARAGFLLLALPDLSFGGSLLFLGLLFGLGFQLRFRQPVSPPADSPAAPTPPATRRPPAPSRTSHPQPHPLLRHAATALLLPPAVSSPPRSSAHSSSPCACWHCPASCCHRSPRVPASPTPLSHTTARLGKTAPPAPPHAVSETPPKCYGRDVRRPPSTETLYLRRSLPRSCASCSSRRSSRTAAPAPSSSAHRRLALARLFPHRTHRQPQDPGHPPHPPESVLSAFLAANHAGTAGVAAPGSHPRIESTFPWPHLKPKHPHGKTVMFGASQNLFPTYS